MIYRNLKYIFYSMTIFIAFSVLLEFSFRSIMFFVHGPEKESTKIVFDEALGWAHNTKMKRRTGNNRCNEPVVRVASTHRLINKFPKYSGTKAILFIGDSTTHADRVSIGMAYYDIFEQLEKNNYSVYAAGIGGFGNLQEYLTLEEIFDDVKPDIVVWQLTDNDIVNNVYELDDSSIFHNQRPRPYLNLKNNEIEVKNPGFWLFDWSHGFRYVFGKILIFDRMYQLRMLERLDSIIELDSREAEGYRNQALEVLDRLLGKAVEKFPAAKFYGFSTDAGYDKEYENIFKKNGATYFGQFFDYVDSIEGTNCAPLDGHWNHLGNKVAGETIRKLLKRYENDEKNSERHYQVNHNLL